jgi:signal transduction histidine kinase
MTDSGSQIRVLQAPALLVRRSIENRRVVLGAAALMFAALLLGLHYVDDPAQGIGLLAVVPITLVALELGLRGGVAAAALGLAILVWSALTGHPDIGAVGLATRAAVFASVGLIAGRFSDRMRQAERRERALLQSGLRLSAVPDKAELPALVAESALGAVDADGAVATFDGLERASIGCAETLAASAAVDVHGATLGHIEVSKRDPLEPEDLATLRLLALQAGLALDNLLLLERERERGAVEAQLRAARRRLSEQRSELDYLVNDQERERSEVAQKLHEELAQILAAVLWGMELLPAGPEQNGGAVQLPQLRTHVVSVLDDLRQLAGSLRPASLDQLDLVSALGFLAERSQQSGGVELSINAGPLPARLPDPIQTGVYRIVEEAVRLIEPDADATPVSVEVEECGRVLRLALTLPLTSERGSSLAAIRGRVDLLGGSLLVQAVAPRVTRLLVDVPLERSGSAPLAA